MIVTPLVKGFGMGASLIMAIGAQNAFVLKQGLKRHHLFLTAITCFICDSVLIVLGVTGLGLIIDDFPTLVNALRWGGALFLVAYGIRSFISVFNPHALIAELDGPKKNRLATLAALLAFTLLNPHTYIDTFLILGNVGAQHPVEEHLPFVVGALGASFAWFFGLTYGASTLSHVFRNPRAWQILDAVMGFVMLSIAYSLVI
ncbi:MAG: LysE/ArgO family amino acid transporter [Candidatus Berkiella sp.]